MEQERKSRRAGTETLVRTADTPPDIVYKILRSVADRSGILDRHGGMGSFPRREEGGTTRDKGVTEHARSVPVESYLRSGGLISRNGKRNRSREERGGYACLVRYK